MIDHIWSTYPADSKDGRQIILGFQSFLYRQLNDKDVAVMLVYVPVNEKSFVNGTPNSDGSDDVRCKATKKLFYAHM
jgi:hypothetical protein